MVKKKNIFEFDSEFDTGNVIAEQIAHLYLASGNRVRLLFDPDGLKIIILKSSLDNGDIVIVDDVEFFGSLGGFPKTAR